jgi:hypothetical protein
MKQKIRVLSLGLAFAGLALVIATPSFGSDGDLILNGQQIGEILGSQATRRSEEANEARGFRNASYGMGQLKEAGGWGKQGMGGFAAAKALGDAWKPLTDTDKSIVDQMKGGPRIPSKCIEGTGCSSCFEAAQDSLNTNRFALIKLGAIGKWTDNFTKKSLAFGDSASGVHGVTGIAWAYERQKIEASYASFGTQYDAKYRELIGYLENSLRKVGQCEAKYFKSDDWYDRYGFIYYSFMADRYRR